MLLNLQLLITSCKIPNTADNRVVGFVTYSQSCDFAHAQTTVCSLDQQDLDSLINKTANIEVKNCTVYNCL